MNTQRGQPVATRAPWVVVLSVVLVVPGTLLSIAFGAIGAILLAALAVDWLARAGGNDDRPRRLPVAVQLAVGVSAAAAVGAGIALGAWIIQS